VDEETNKIREHIDAERDELGRNLDEIEYRLKKATDFKTYFDRNTGWILGAAVTGGFLLSRVVRKSAASGVISHSEPRPTERMALQRPSMHLSQISETLDNIFEGLVGVVSEKMHSFVADAVPGFREQYDAAERQRPRPSAPQMKRL
jgi:hypothetical protein